MTALPDKRVIGQFLDSPEVREYHARKRQRELELHGNSLKVPMLSAAAIGLGYGARRFGDWVISDQDLGKVNELMAFDKMVDRRTGKANADWSGSTDFYTQYLDRAGRAAQARGFGGRSAGDLMVAYRKHIEPLIGGKYPVTTKDQEEAAYEHYNTFESGPAQALIHQLKSYTKNRPEAERNEILGKATHDFATSAAAYTGKDPATVERDLTDLKTPLNKDQYSFGTQLDLVRNYLGSFSGKNSGPENEWGRKNILPLIDSIRKGNASAALGYKGLAAPLNALHNIPKAVGAGLMGLGAAGLVGWGGYKLYDKITKNRREREALAAERRQRATLVRHLLKNQNPKQANEMKSSDRLKAAYAGYTNQNVQTLLPISQRRQGLNAQEQVDIAQGKQQWIPKIFENLSDSPAVRMTSPGHSAVLGGSLVGVPAALLTAAGTGSAGAGLGVGLGAGGLAALLSYLGTHRRNQDIEETMRRLPEGSNIRDFDADPLMAERRRFSHDRAMATHAGVGAGFGAGTGSGIALNWNAR